MFDQAVQIVCPGGVIFVFYIILPAGLQYLVSKSCRVGRVCRVQSTASSLGIHSTSSTYPFWVWSTAFSSLITYTFSESATSGLLGPNKRHNALTRRRIAPPLFALAESNQNPFSTKACSLGPIVCTRSYWKLDVKLRSHLGNKANKKITKMVMKSWMPTDRLTRERCAHHEFSEMPLVLREEAIALHHNTIYINQPFHKIPHESQITTVQANISFIFELSATSNNFSSIIEQNYEQEQKVLAGSATTPLAQLPGTTSIHVQIFNIELKAKMKSYHMPDVQSKPPLNWLDPLSNQKLTALHPSSVTLQLLQNLITSILSFRQCRSSIENTPKSIHNIRNDAQQILVYSQTSIASLLKVSPSHVGYCWQSGKPTSSEGHDFLEAIRPREITAMGDRSWVVLWKWNRKNDFEPAKMFDSARNLVEILLDFNLWLTFSGACEPYYLSKLVRVDMARSENEVQANMDLEFQRNNEISTFVRLGHQLNSTIFSLFLQVLVSSTKEKVFRGVVQNQPWLVRPSSGELVELHSAIVTGGGLENQLGSCILIRFHVMEIMRYTRQKDEEAWALMILEPSAIFPVGDGTPQPPKWNRGSMPLELELLGNCGPTNKQRFLQLLCQGILVMVGLVCISHEANPAYR
ncbi:hypothetical protein LguiA_012875 [Lonicera macranthoides]